MPRIQTTERLLLKQEQGIRCSRLDRSIEQASRSRRVDVRGNNERSKSTHMDILCLLTLGVNIRSLCLNDLKSPAWSEKSGKWGVKSGSFFGGSPRTRLFWCKVG